MHPTSFNRSAGRLFNELRPFKVEWDPMGFPLSSLIIHSGNTAVLCSVCLEEGVPSWMTGRGKGWLTSEYRLLPGSTPQRQKRELVKLSGRTQEVQRLISRSLRAVIDLKALGERTLLVDCDVIQADAGTRTTSITGAWIALKKAIDKLLEDGRLNKNPIKGQVAAVSVGLFNQTPLLDLDYSEDSQAEVDLNVVMDANGNFLEIQGTAEKKSFTRDQLSIFLDLAEEGIMKLQASQLIALK